MNKAAVKKFWPLIVALILVAAGFLLFGDRIGVPKSRLEEDLRTSQNVPDNWTVIGNVSDKAAIFLYYPPEENRYTWSIYVNRPGLSFGYFFRGSMSTAGIDCSKEELPTEVEAIPVGDSGEVAYISMNFNGLVRAEVNDGADIQIIDLDESKPFALLLSHGPGQVTFYDQEGNPAEIETRKI